MITLTNNYLYKGKTSQIRPAIGDTKIKNTSATETPGGVEDSACSYSFNVYNFFNLYIYNNLMTG